MQENRFHERVPCHLQFSCKHYYNQMGQMMRLGDCSDFVVENLSVGGIMAKSAIDLPIDAIIEYTLYLESVPYVIMSQIKWRTQSKDNTYTYGMAFLTISNMMFRHLKAYTSQESFYQIDIPNEPVVEEGFEPLSFVKLSEDLHRDKK